MCGALDTSYYMCFQCDDDSAIADAPALQPPPLVRHPPPPPPPPPPPRSPPDSGLGGGSTSLDAPAVIVRRLPRRSHGATQFMSRSYSHRLSSPLAWAEFHHISCEMETLATPLRSHGATRFMSQRGDHRSSSPLDADAVAALSLPPALQPPPLMRHPPPPPPPRSPPNRLGVADRRLRPPSVTNIYPYFSLSGAECIYWKNRRLEFSPWGMRGGANHEHGPPGDVPGIAAEASNRGSQGATAPPKPSPSEATETGGAAATSFCVAPSRAGDCGAGCCCRCAFACTHPPHHGIRIS